MAGNPVVQFAGGSYRLADKKAAIASSINLYPQRLEGERLMMADAPGRTLETALGAEVRGMFRTGIGRVYVVAGSTFYERTSAGVYVTWGTLATTTGFVGMDDNESQVAIVDGPNLYVFTESISTFVTVSSAGWLGSDDVREIDGYMVFVDPATERFYVSAIDDAATLNALDFSSADVAPDHILTHRVSHRQLFFFGSTTTEIWVNSGENDFPFARYQSYTIDVGIVGKRAAVNAADTLMFVGRTERGTGIVYQINANQPVRVSNLAVEEVLAASTDIAGVTMWAYQIEGHEFVGLNIPGAETTWVYDAAMPPAAQWSERGEWNAGWVQDRVGLHLYAGDGHICGDSDGNVYMLDDTSTLAGLVKVRERTWPHFVAPSYEPVSYRSLEMLCTTGEGAGWLTLEISNDGGKTFGPPLLRSLGAIGRWMQRVRWLGLGAATNRVFRLRCSSAVPLAIHGATVDAG